VILVVCRGFRFPLFCVTAAKIRVRVISPLEKVADVYEKANTLPNSVVQAPSRPTASFKNHLFKFVNSVGADHFLTFVAFLLY